MFTSLHQKRSRHELKGYHIPRRIAELHPIFAATVPTVTCLVVVRNALSITQDSHKNRIKPPKADNPTQNRTQRIFPLLSAQV